MRPPGAGPFLRRPSYRRRRLVDAARLLPVFGVALFLLPLVWPTVPAEGVSLSIRGIYLFAVWGGLVAAAFALSRRLRPRPAAAGRSGAGRQVTEAGDDVL